MILDFITIQNLILLVIKLLSCVKIKKERYNRDKISYNIIIML